MKKVLLTMFAVAISAGLLYAISGWTRPDGSQISNANVDQNGNVIIAGSTGTATSTSVSINGSSNTIQLSASQNATLVSISTNTNVIAASVSMGTSFTTGSANISSTSFTQELPVNSNRKYGTIIYNPSAYNVLLASASVMTSTNACGQFGAEGSPVFGTAAIFLRMIDAAPTTNIPYKEVNQ